jgi:hypothetical protein
MSINQRKLIHNLKTVSNRDYLQNLIKCFWLPFDVVFLYY